MAGSQKRRSEMSYSGQDCVSTVPFGKQLTISERLFQQKKDLTERLALIEEAIKAVESVPNLQQALDAISKVGY